MNRAESLSKFKNVLRAQFAGPRHCSQCREKKPRQGGKEITYNDGKNQRWVCAGCA